MKSRFLLLVGAIAAAFLLCLNAGAQTNSSMAGRNIIKLLPDYLRPQVLALNKGTGSAPGTVLALDPTNGTILKELTVSTNPTDMAIAPEGDALLVIHQGSQTISKIDLASFRILYELPIISDKTYTNPLYLAVGPSNVVFYTDGHYPGPQIYSLNFASGLVRQLTDTSGYTTGAGQLALSRDGKTLYTWKQSDWMTYWTYDWNLSVLSYAVLPDTSLSLIGTSPSATNGTLDTPILVDGGGRWVFSMNRRLSAVNVPTLLATFDENIYAVSLDGSVAFGRSKVFNALTGLPFKDFPFPSSVQTLSGDQKRLFRYNASTANLAIYNMADIAQVSGPEMVPAPADKSFVTLPAPKLSWSPFPNALSYKVYVSTNRTALEAAIPPSQSLLALTSDLSVPVQSALSVGQTYYWRVDAEGLRSTNTGPVWSFTVSSLVCSPQRIDVGWIAAYAPPSATLALTSQPPQVWNARVTGANWLTLDSTNVTTPGTLTLGFNSSSLPAGIYENNIELTSGNQTINVPVTLNLETLNITKMVADIQRPYIYAIQSPPKAPAVSHLLFINSVTSNIDYFLPIGRGPADFTINYMDQKLYAICPGGNSTYIVDLGAQKLLPPTCVNTTNLDARVLNTPVNVYAAGPGKLVIQPKTGWNTTLQLVDTNGNFFGSDMVYDGQGAFDLMGNSFYYDEPCSAHLNVYTTATGSLRRTATIYPPESYRNGRVAITPDGSLVFWGYYVNDPSLTQPWTGISEQIYTTTAHGDLALSEQHAINVRTKETVYTWPFATTIMAVSGDQQKVFLYNSALNQLVCIPMSSIAPVPDLGVSPTPASNAVVQLPLSQLSWTRAPLCWGYHVFFGTSSSDVANAGTNSALYLGYTTNNSLPLSAPLTPGTTYYWRVDSVGLSGLTPGPVWPLTVSPITVSPQALEPCGVLGTPIFPKNFSLSAPTPTPWSLSSAQPWMSATITNGVTPSTVSLRFDTTNLPVGTYRNQLTVRFNGLEMQLPVTLRIFDLNVSRMIADPNRDYIYALHPGSGKDYDAFLLFINANSGVTENIIPIGINPTDMTINRFEDRLYVSNYGYNRTPVVDLKTQQQTTVLTLGRQVFRINAGKSNRIIVEDGGFAEVNINLVDSSSGIFLDSSQKYWGGDSAIDPGGNIYYHYESYYYTHLHKAVIAEYGAVVNVADASISSGETNMVISADGSRIFCGGKVFDTNLVSLGTLGAEIFSCSTNGALAFGSRTAFDASTMQIITNLPVASAATGVDRSNQHLWYFNSSTHRVENIPLVALYQPWITNQPAAATGVLAGSNVTLTVTARGLGPLSYQWLFSGTPILGQTNSSLSLTNVQLSQEGGYQVVVTNLYGSVTSAVAQVIMTLPVILQQPFATNVSAGQTLTLQTTASGLGLKYQWYFENTKIPTGSNSTLTISNVQSVNEGAYRFVVQNSFGAVTSSVAFVRVSPAAPSLLANPTSLVVPAGSNALFNVTAIGSSTLAYQWLLNETAIQGAVSPLYSITNAQSTNAGSYRVVVSNMLGVVTSAVATLSVNPTAPFFVTQPVGATLPAGTNLTLAALARGTEPISYRWLHNGNQISGISNPSLALNNLQALDGGSYTLVASNIVGSTTSVVASVTVMPSAPRILMQPTSQTATTGNAASLSVYATGTQPLQYQWYFQNNPVLGQTNAQLYMRPATLTMSGSYYVVVSNSVGAVTSAVATLTVNQAPITVFSGLTNIVADFGSNVVLSVDMSGIAPLTYSWTFNGSAIPGTNSMLVLTNVGAAQSGFYSVRTTCAMRDGSYSVIVSARVSVLGKPGTPVAWGCNTNGQASAPTDLTDVVALAGGDYHTLALRHDGTLVAWGSNNDGQTNLPGAPPPFVAIAVGGAHNLAIRDTGSLVAWGRNDSGQTTIPYTIGNVLSVAAGESHSLALQSTKTVRAWGNNTYGQTNVPQGLSGVCAVAAGSYHSLALLTNGTVVCWGLNTSGQSTPPTTLTNAIAIAAGFGHSVALRADGTVAAWGDNTYGQTNVPAHASNIVAITAGNTFTLALRADGTVIGWGDNSFQQSQFPSTLAGAYSIAAGAWHGLSLTSPPPWIHSELTNGVLLLRWQGAGVLQASPFVSGPFTNVLNPTNPYTNTNLSEPSLFFRLKVQ